MSRTFRSRQKVTDCFTYEGYSRSYGYFHRGRDDEWHRESWAKATRDGRWNETGRNRAFKELCREDARARDRRAIRGIMIGKDDDEVEFSIRKHGKTFVWAVW